MVTYDALVLSGGGIKGIGMLGAVAALKKHNVLDTITTFVGVSVGSIVATILAMKLDPRVVFDTHVLGFTYAPDIDITRLDKTFGLDSGKYLEHWIAMMIPEMTFAEFHETYATTLVIVATNLNTHGPKYLSHTTTPDMSVRLALRMSCSIPLYFSAIQYRGELYVDGGMSNNFPIEYPGAVLGSRRVLGIRFKASPRPPDHAWTLERFLGSLVESNVNRSTYAHVPSFVIELDTHDVNPTNFKIKPKERITLFQSGYTQTQLFIKKIM
jgi:predicted acylesterase/phospholipase RssA